MLETNKKYQVFVSSTYEDLQFERQEVIHALLELDCIPSGMELFPAADEDQWSLIKDLIDDCDYYIVIIGGRYGSIGPKDISYTEMEYRYALEKGKPIIAFLHKNPDSLPKNKTEKSPESQEKLENFRSFAQQKMCKFWENAKDLGSVVSRSLINLQKRHPGIGWVRGNTISKKDAELEILQLKQEIENLKASSKSTFIAPSGSDQYAQGDDTVSIGYSFKSTDKEKLEYSWTDSVNVTWNKIYYLILPLMINSANDSILKRELSEFIYEMQHDKYTEDDDVKNHNLYNFEIKENDYMTIIIQARALGLISKEDKKRVSYFDDTNWILTPYGDKIMTELRAIKKEKTF